MEFKHQKPPSLLKLFQAHILFTFITDYYCKCQRLLYKILIVPKKYLRRIGLTAPLLQQSNVWELVKAKQVACVNIFFTGACLIKY